jgi:hypothetical protein
VSLSRRLLEARGLRVLSYRIVADGTRLDVVGSVAKPGLGVVARDGRGLVAAAVTSPRERFAVLVSLLRSAAAARLVRQGTRIEVHCWTRREGGGRMCEVVELTQEDYPGLAPPAPARPV